MTMKKLSLIGVLVALLSTYCLADDTSSYLWNLEDDPYEDTNLYDDDEYSAMREYLISELKNAIYNQTNECDGDTTNSVSAEAEAAYELCGGVCPYEDDTYEMDIEQIYFPSDPPHIVFMLVDDWGYNDVGLQSTFMSWTTPDIDRFATEGITLSNYFTHYYCVPSRGALMTGRTANRLGQIIATGQNCGLPLTEVTLAQEMKSAGYRTYLVGKWDLGMVSYARTPLYRGFDYFYGYYSGLIDYYTKKVDTDYLDLQKGLNLETDADLLSESTHTAYIFQDKVEAVLRDHAANYSDTPMFLYYAIQLIHSPFDVPSVYSDRCGVTSTSDDVDDDYDLTSLPSYCGLNIMLNEVVANTTCLLESLDFADNTYVVLASDNGGSSSISGNSVPFKGHKFDLSRGGVSAHAYIFSKMLSSSVRGATYSGLMHVSDWLPTLMYVATEGEWTGSYSGATLDGVSQWTSIMSLSDTSPRSLIVHYAYYEEYYTGSIQYNYWKLDVNISSVTMTKPSTITEENDDWYILCSNPSYTETTPSALLTLLDIPEESASFYLFGFCVALLAVLVLTMYAMLQVR